MATPNSARITRKTVRLGANAAENECAQRPAGERQHDCERDLAFLHPEFVGHVLQNENQQKEVERIERPAQVACDDYILLRRRPAL
jgi:hypothetical protein